MKCISSSTALLPSVTKSQHLHDLEDLGASLLFSYMLKSTWHHEGVWDFVLKQKRKSNHRSKKPITSGVCLGHTNQTPNHRFGGVGIETPRAGPRSQPLTVEEVRS